MERQEVFAWLKDTLIRDFEVVNAEISERARLAEDLGLDSLDAIDLAVHIQERTGTKLDDQMLRTLVTVGDAVTLIATLGVVKG